MAALATPDHREIVDVDCSSAVGSGHSLGLGAVLSMGARMEAGDKQSFQPEPNHRLFLLPFPLCQRCKDTSRVWRGLLDSHECCHAVGAVSEFTPRGDVGIRCTAGTGKTPAPQTHVWKSAALGLGIALTHAVKQVSSLSTKEYCRKGLV